MKKNFLVRYEGSRNGRSYQYLHMAQRFASRVDGVIFRFDGAYWIRL